MISIRVETNFFNRKKYLSFSDSESSVDIPMLDEPQTYPFVGAVINEKPLEKLRAWLNDRYEKVKEYEND